MISPNFPSLCSGWLSDTSLEASDLPQVVSAGGGPHGHTDNTQPHRSGGELLMQQWSDPHAI